MGYVMFLLYHTSSNAVWRFMLWHVCTIMAIKLFEFEFEVVYIQFGVFPPCRWVKQEFYLMLNKKKTKWSITLISLILYFHTNVWHTHKSQKSIINEAAIHCLLAGYIVVQKSRDRISLQHSGCLKDNRDQYGCHFFLSFNVFNTLMVDITWKLILIVIWSEMLKFRYREVAHLFCMAFAWRRVEKNQHVLHFVLASMW